MNSRFAGNATDGTEGLPKETKAQSGNPSGHLFVHWTR